MARNKTPKPAPKSGKPFPPPKPAPKGGAMKPKKGGKCCCGGNH